VAGRKPVRTSTSKSAEASEATFGARPPERWDEVEGSTDGENEGEAYEGERERKWPEGMEGPASGEVWVRSRDMVATWLVSLGR
jgi:hypothetical protein